MKKLLMGGFVINLIVGFFLGNIGDAILFSLVFTIIFYVPILFWTNEIKTNNFNKLIITNILAISIIPLLLAIIGSFTSFNKILFILPSTIIILTKIGYKKYLKQK